MREASLVSHFSTTSDPGDVVTPPRLPPRKGLALALTTASPLLLLAPPRPALALAPAAAREGGGCRGGVHSPAAHNPAMRLRWAATLVSLARRYTKEDCLFGTQSPLFVF